ncbi:N-acetylmuramoyl-L-alanine amidase family protein [Marinicrinis lubricantis]|uniref:N-acetylmuramoyl-L-alanine amidase n=1 Tax=Marinicrinis lubricantis TaxID=2086470 RepID=A0ABW1INJ5_9BACL
MKIPGACLRVFLPIALLIGVWGGIASSATAAEPNLPIFTTDVLIDAGHGGIDGGASYGSILEKDMNLSISKKLYQILVSHGYHPVLHRMEDYALSDDNRWLRTSRHLKDLALELKPKLMVSLHMNVSSSPAHRGPLVIYPQRNRISYEFASLLQDELNRLYGLKKIARMGSAFYILKQDICPAVIIEMGFISNKQDRQWLLTEDGQRKLAEAIYHAIDEYFIQVY